MKIRTLLFLLVNEPFSLVTLQLPKVKSGWGLPNLDMLVIQAWTLSSWVRGGCSAVKTLSLNKFHRETPPPVKGSFLNKNVLWAWGKLRTISESSSVNILVTLDDPELSLQSVGSNFTSWQRAGIKRIYNLFDNGSFKTPWSLNITFQVMISINTYKLDIISSESWLMRTFPPETVCWKSFSLNHRKHKHFVTKFYSDICSLNLDKLVKIRMMFGTKCCCCPSESQHAIDIKSYNIIYCIIFIFHHIFIVSIKPECPQAVLNVRLQLEEGSIVCGNHSDFLKNSLCKHQ